MGALRRARPRAGGGCLIEALSAPLLVLEREGSPAALLAAAYRTGDSGRDAGTAVMCRATSSALVLGSTQRESGFDLARCSAAGLEVVRRRSGGGAVVVRPGAQIWVDFFVPRDDPLFDDDVLASFRFVGEIWAAAIGECLPSISADRIAVATGRPVANPWSATLCFAGLGAGEVSVDGRKVVGVSQRRDRRGAWFHSMALLEFDPLEIASLLAAPESRKDEAAAVLAGSAAAVPGGRASDASLTQAVRNCIA